MRPPDEKPRWNKGQINNINFFYSHNECYKTGGQDVQTNFPLIRGKNVLKYELNCLNPTVYKTV